MIPVGKGRIFPSRRCFWCWCGMAEGSRDLQERALPTELWGFHVGIWVWDGSGISKWGILGNLSVWDGSGISKWGIFGNLSVWDGSGISKWGIFGESVCLGWLWDLQVGDFWESVCLGWLWDLQVGDFWESGISKGGIFGNLSCVFGMDLGSPSGGFLGICVFGMDLGSPSGGFWESECLGWIWDLQVGDFWESVWDGCGISKWGIFWESGISKWGIFGNLECLGWIWDLQVGDFWESELCVWDGSATSTTSKWWILGNTQVLSWEEFPGCAGQVGREGPSLLILGMSLIPAFPLALGVSSWRRARKGAGALSVPSAQGHSSPGTFHIPKCCWGSLPCVDIAALWILLFWDDFDCFLGNKQTFPDAEPVPAFLISPAWCQVCPWRALTCSRIFGISQAVTRAAAMELLIHKSCRAHRSGLNP
ncbi:uncharacterized protein LOC125337252 isoform X3 [Corvus hawaiiensis]|uniref:uncharacterized protein LOC125337252 isoform X3 n=1 Tax=Corvus hawaiiensis TaxID=134902 RepID=UPI002019F24B|nr:uncharacterized protein LOC125337252 isoform X3 [Corvus hawaiiensis]